MVLGKAMTMGAVVAAVVLVGMGIALAAQLAPGEQGGKATLGTGTVSPSSPAPSPRASVADEPLPPRALVRLGTTRLRHGQPITEIAFSLESKTILAADWNAVRVWDSTTGQALRAFGDPRGRQFQSVAFSADGKVAALSRPEGEVEIWDVAAGRQLREFQAGRFPALTFSPDGKQLAVLDVGTLTRPIRSLRLFDVTTGQPRRRLEGHQDVIHGFLFTPDGKTLITSSDDKSIRFWDTATGKQIRQWNTSTAIGRIELSPDGTRLVSVATNKHESTRPTGGQTVWWHMVEPIIVWDYTTGREICRLEGPMEWINEMGFTPDSKRIVIDNSKGLYWWDVGTGKRLTDRTLAVGPAVRMAFTRDGGTLATGYTAICLWDVATGKQKPPRSGHQDVVHAVAFSEDSRTCFTASGDRVIRFWDPNSGTEIGQLVGHESAVLSVALVPYKRQVLSTGQDETARLWDLAARKELYRIPCERSALSSDGKLLVTHSKDKRMRLWEIATGREVRKWPAADIRTLAFSPNGRVIYSYGEDHQIRLWETATGKEQRRFEGHHFREDSKLDRVYDVVFSLMAGSWRLAAIPTRSLFTRWPRGPSTRSLKPPRVRSVPWPFQAIRESWLPATGTATACTSGNWRPVRKSSSLPATLDGFSTWRSPLMASNC